MFSPVVVDDGVDPVSYGDDRTVPQVFPDSPLYQSVCVHVHGRRRLVQHQDLSPTEERPRQAQQLALPNAGNINTLIEPAFRNAARDVSLRSLQRTIINYRNKGSDCEV